MARLVAGEKGGGMSSDRQLCEERVNQTLDYLRPIDDSFMRVVMKDQLPLAERVVRLVTGIQDLTLTRMETQRDLKALEGRRSAVLDVWCEDVTGARHNVEVQRWRGRGSRRARFYSAAMDVDTLQAEQKFKDLPVCYVIFVMEKDPYGREVATYHVDRAVVTRDGEPCVPFDDGAHIIYANATYKGDDELGRLLRDFLKSDPSQMQDPLMRERVQYLKNTSEGRAEMGDAYERFREQDRAEGRAEGLAEGRVEGLAEGMAGSVRALMETLQWTASQAFDALKVPEGDRPRYLEMLGAGR